MRRQRETEDSANERYDIIVLTIILTFFIHLSTGAAVEERALPPTADRKRPGSVAASNKLNPINTTRRDYSILSYPILSYLKRPGSAAASTSGLGREFRDVMFEDVGFDNRS